MLTTTQRLHALAGSPPFDEAGDMHGRCWICAGTHARGILIGKWQAASYTDQNKARVQSATHVCEPCAWACSWVVPPGFPPPEQGKKGLNLRLFSHLHDDRGYLALNKASKPAILKWLREPKQGEWFAAIADTGQKHVLPWTPVNVAPNGGVVRFEETNVTLPRDDRGWRVVDGMIALLSLGVTKGEIESGDYYPRSWQQHAQAIRDFEHEHDMRRSGAWFGLALWLSQRDEDTYATNTERAREAARQNREGSARDKSAVPRKRRERAEALATDPRPSTDLDSNGGQRGGVGHVDVPRFAFANAKQGSLFGDD